MSINGKFAFYGFNLDSRFVADIVIPFDTEAACTFAAKLWAKCYNGRAECYCIQDGHIGGRAFAVFGTETITSGDYRYLQMRNLAYRR